MQTGPSSKSSPLVSADDHEAGFKELSLKSRGGKTLAVVLTAPGHRVARSLGIEINRTKEFICVVAECLGKEFIEALPNIPLPDVKETLSPAQIRERFDDNRYAKVSKWMDKLSLESAAVVESVSLTLTFGDDFQKKILLAGAMALLARAQALPRSVPKSSSSAPDSTATT